MSGVTSASGVSAALASWRPRLTALHRRLALAGPAERWISVSAPFTGEPLAEIPVGGAADVALAVERARGRREGWASAPAAARAGVALRFHDLLIDRGEDLLDVVQLETGKARVHAFEELVDAAVTARYYGVRVPRLLRASRRRGALPLLTRTRVHRRPVGVVGCVIPWNYPLSLAVADALPALLAGNAVVLKPDPQTSHTALFVAELLAAAGLPEGVLAVMTGDGPETGAAVVDATDFVAFTGSTATGRGVAARAAERLVGFSLELGGKNAMIVRADADLDRAVRGALRGSFTNSGQLCISIERLLVHASRFEEFLSRFAALASTLRLGASLDYRAEIGSLVSSEQLEKVRAHVQDAVARGATLHAGGQARPDIGPLFYEPTVLTGVRAGMRCHDEETFGPVVALRPFTDDDEAVALANQGRQGLSASIWTRDRRTAGRLAAGLVVGSVNVNEAFSAGWGSIDAPMGGFRESGIGRRHGREGLLRFTEAQTVAEQRLLPLDVASLALDARGRRLVRGALRMVRRLPGLG